MTSSFPYSKARPTLPVTSLPPLCPMWPNKIQIPASRTVLRKTPYGHVLRGKKNGIPQKFYTKNIISLGIPFRTTAKY